MAQSMSEPTSNMSVRGEGDAETRQAQRRDSSHLSSDSEDALSSGPFSRRASSTLSDPTTVSSRSASDSFEQSGDKLVTHNVGVTLVEEREQEDDDDEDSSSDEEQKEDNEMRNLKAKDRALIESNLQAVCDEDTARANWPPPRSDESALELDDDVQRLRLEGGSAVIHTAEQIRTPRWEARPDVLGFARRARRSSAGTSPPPDSGEPQHPQQRRRSSSGFTLPTLQRTLSPERWHVKPSKPSAPPQQHNDAKEEKQAPRAPTNGRKESFDRFSTPSAKDLNAAADMQLIGEDPSSPTTLRDIIAERRPAKVIVVFMRHLWCTLCESYARALQAAMDARVADSKPTIPELDEERSAGGSDSDLSTPASSTEAPVYIVLISTGSPSLIPLYRSQLACPFPLYVAKSRLYEKLGMRKSWASGDDEDEHERGSYADSAGSAVWGGVANAFRRRAYPGKQRQLGGEFVLHAQEDGTLECSYASRMSTSRNHSDVSKLFAAAGVELPPGLEELDAATECKVPELCSRLS